MRTRREMKAAARKSLKKHYILFVAVCLISAFIGSEFSGFLGITRYNPEKETKSSDSLSSVGPAGSQPNAMNAILEALTGNAAAGKNISDSLIDEEVEKTKSGKGNAALGRSRGVLAMIANSFSSGAVFVTAISAVNSLTKSENITITIFILLSLLFIFLLWFFLFNMYVVVSRRIFLEALIYEKVPIQRFAFLLRVKKWTKVSCTLFVRSLFQFLWNLTIVGGAIKHYSYFMVPYIVAENPDILPLQAISLSRKMMDGHKWECFTYNISFIGWDILGYATLGLSGILFSNPYRIAAFSEYYAGLRLLAIDNNLEGTELFNDVYLFQRADDALLQDSYSDVVHMMQIPDVQLKKLSGVSGFFANVFGITLSIGKDERAYEEVQIRDIEIQLRKAALEGTSYPGRLFPIPDYLKNKRLETLHYLRHYSIWSLILLFFIFSFLGWVWEVSLHMIIDGIFVNRGVLHGPWLPIYGAGGVLILTVLNKLRKTPVLEFLFTVILCGCVEYFSSYYLELTHNGTKWWDYSGYFLNLNGRICAEGLLVFGVGGLAIVYLAVPLIDNYIRKLRLSLVIPSCILLICIFCADQAYSFRHPNSGKGITDYTGACIEEFLQPAAKQRWEGHS